MRFLVGDRGAPRAADTCQGELVALGAGRFQDHRGPRLSQGPVPASSVYGNTGYAALRLITRRGSFDEQSRHYRSSVVAFALSGVFPPGLGTLTPGPGRSSSGGPWRSCQ